MFIPLHDSNPLQNIRLQYVTLGIIVTNVLIWAFFDAPLIADPKAAQTAAISFGFIPSVANEIKILPPEFLVLPTWTSYVTYAFLHADFMHLAGNMLFLWVFGDNVEDAMGHFRFLIFYFLCAAAGAWAHALVLPSSDSPLIGASGAAAGVIGAYLMLHPHVRIWVLALGRIPLRLKAMWILSAWVAYQLGMMLFASDGQVSWSAHVGGVAAGIILIVFLRKSGVPLFDREPLQAIKTPPDGEQSSPNPVKSRWGRNSDNNQ